MINKSLLDLFETSMKRADGVLQEAAASPAMRHLRLASVELLRAARCGVDAAIDLVEPKRHPQPPPPSEEQQ